MEWTMKNGEKILISDMSDFHLMNVRKMIHRNNGIGIQEIEDEVEKRGLILSCLIKCCTKCNTVDIKKDHVCDFAHMINKEYNYK